MKCALADGYGGFRRARFLGRPGCTWASPKLKLYRAARGAADCTGHVAEDASAMPLAGCPLRERHQSVSSRLPTDPRGRYGRLPFGSPAVFFFESFALAGLALRVSAFA